MMKKYLTTKGLLTLIALCFAFVGYAQKMKSFPSMMPSMMGVPMVQPQNSYEINPKKGVLMYGSTMKDSDGNLHYVKFYENDAYNVEKLFEVYPEDNGLHVRKLRAGALTPKGYYGYIVDVLSYVEVPQKFVKVDFEGKKVTEIADLTHIDYEVWPTIYEMAYDYKRNKVWALGRNKDEIKSDVFSINLTDGTYKKEATLGFYAWAFAVNYDGDVYAVKAKLDANDEKKIGSYLTKLDADNKFKEVSQWEMKPDGEAFIPDFTHAMEFDHESNKLYWLGVNNYYDQRIFVIDVDKKTIARKGQFYANHIVSLGIPFIGADNRDAAGKVNDLKGTSPEDNSLKATLTWTNPTTNWRGGNLETLLKVTVSKGTRDNVIATVDAKDKMGTAMTWTDEKATQGINKYFLTTYRKDGEKGLVDSINVHAGVDVPGNVENIRIQAVGEDIRLEWTKPSSSATGKNYDEATLKYDIVRMPDNKTVATDLTNTSFVDNTVATYGKYYYVITSKNKEGVGQSAKSTAIFAGKAYTPTFVEDFATQEQADRWTSVDNNQDLKMFNYSGGKLKELMNFLIYSSMTAKADDYLFSPKFALKAGKSYRVVFDAFMATARDAMYSFAITYGKEPVAAGQTKVVAFEDIRPKEHHIVKSYQGMFTAPEDGTFHVGFHYYSDPSAPAGSMGVTGFKIEEVFDVDLAAAELTTQGLVAETPSAVTVKVKNVGKTAKANYKVQVLNAADNSVLGETTVAEELAAEAEADVSVQVTMAQSGKVNLIGKVILAGDLNAANDMTKATEFNVLPKGSATWNIELNGKNPGQSTTEPMNFMNHYSTVEMVYTAKEIDQTKGTAIHGIAFQGTPNDLAEAVKTKVKIYMGNTDKKDTYSSPTKADEWSKNETLTKVFDGEVTLEPGTETVKIPFMFDTPFEYQLGKNLVVQVWKEGESSNLFPILFNVYNVDWYNPMMIRYNGRMEFSYLEEFFAVAGKPVGFLAMGISQGINDMTVGGNVSYNESEGTLSFNGMDVARVQVFDTMGRLVAAQNVAAGQTTMKASLGKGIYVLKLVAGNGKTNTQKIAIR